MSTQPQHSSAGLARSFDRSIATGERRGPTNQRELVIASLIARPDRPVAAPSGPRS